MSSPRSDAAGVAELPLPWERQPRESAEAFEAFAAYREMEPSQRSQRSVGQQLGKSSALMGRWSAEHRWVERVEAWDAELDRQWRVDLLAQRRRSADRHLRLARAGFSKAAEALAGLDAGTLRPMDLVRLMEVSVRIERDTLGEPTRHEITGPGGDPIAVQLAAFDQLPVETRRARVLELADDVRRRVQATAADADDDAD